MLITVSQDVHCWGVKCKTTNPPQQATCPWRRCKWEGDSISWFHQGLIYHKGQDNWPHTAKPTPLAPPSLADKHRNSAPCRAKWWLVQAEEEEVWKYACKNTRHYKDAIKFSIKCILQSIEILWVAPKHTWNPSRVLPDSTLFHVYALTVFLDFKSF